MQSRRLSPYFHGRLVASHYSQFARTVSPPDRPVYLRVSCHNCSLFLGSRASAAISFGTSPSRYIPLGFSPQTGLLSKAAARMSLEDLAVVRLVPLGHNQVRMTTSHGMIYFHSPRILQSPRRTSVVGVDPGSIPTTEILWRTGSLSIRLCNSGLPNKSIRTMTSND